MISIERDGSTSQSRYHTPRRSFGRKEVHIYVRMREVTSLPAHRNIRRHGHRIPRRSARNNRLSPAVSYCQILLFFSSLAGLTFRILSRSRAFFLYIRSRASADARSGPRVATFAISKIAVNLM